MSNPFSLENKTILITGASAGIGKAIAIECARMGADVVITGRNSARLKETLGELVPGNHTSHEVELTDRVALQSLVESLPALDGVVSNAGAISPMVLKVADEKDVDDLFAVNTLSPIHLTRLLIQEKKLKKAASLVYVSSINGNNITSAGNSIYGASKSALTGFMKGVALELAPRGIRANCINPGMIETDLFKDAAIGSEEFEIDRQKYPLKRYGKPEEVAYAAVYLLSDAAQWVTGSSLVIDGGFTLQ